MTWKNNVNKFSALCEKRKIAHLLNWKAKSISWTANEQQRFHFVKWSYLKRVYYMHIKTIIIQLSLSHTSHILITTYIKSDGFLYRWYITEIWYCASGKVWEGFLYLFQTVKIAYSQDVIIENMFCMYAGSAFMSAPNTVFCRQKINGLSICSLNCVSTQWDLRFGLCT